ncbi:hypothetical protein AAG570_011998 [Ranatra chinensis]|uniref:Uncharacterized protein n=1 Tax=Ranatra chinensis TaxID=642074 RepID=A0ABD0YHR1_9HEMI
MFEKNKKSCVICDCWVALRSGCEVYNGVNLCVRHNPIKMGLINTQERSSGMATQWEQLISSTMTPTTAVAVKLAVTPEEEEGGPVGVVGEVEGGHGVGGGVGTRRRTGLLARIARHWPSLAKIRRAANSEQGSPLFR